MAGGAGETRVPMRFDATRVEALLRELGDPRYAGPEGEARIADFLAGQFAAMGLEVERREVTGSPLPRRLAPWVGWLGYGFLVTSVYGLVLSGRGLLPGVAIVLACSCAPWLDAVLNNRIRPGRRWRARRTAPLVIASRPGRSSASMRVIFQSVISGLEPAPSPLPLRWPIWRMLSIVLYVFPPAWGLLLPIVRAGSGGRPERADIPIVSQLLIYGAYPAFLALAWILILLLLLRVHRHRRATARRDPPDRRGLALLLEMARTWPKTGSRPIEPVFVAAGGQRLDCAGSREVVRLLESEWSSASSLLVLLFEPGAGGELRLSTSPRSSAGDPAKLAEDAARSLWIPYRPDEDLTLRWLWPLEIPTRPVIALIGSGLGASDERTDDPQALHRAAQLATEVALRWAKAGSRGRDDPGIPGSAG